MSIVGTDHYDRELQSALTGIQQMLGKEEFTTPPEVYRECVHESDGFIYEDTPVFITLMCTKCGLHYDQNKV